MSTMDTVPYVFIDSVAHTLSHDSASTLRKISNKNWSIIGHIHRSKRHYEHFSVLFASDDSSLRYFFHKQISRLKNEPAYSRISKITLIGHFAKDPLYLAEIKQVKQFLQSSPYQVNKLCVDFPFHCESEELSFLWRLPVKRLEFEGVSQNDRIRHHIFQYHIQSNPELEELEFSYGTYDHLKMIIEAWKGGLSKLREVIVTLLRAEDWKTLENLGYTPMGKDGTLVDLNLRCAESGRRLCIKPTGFLLGF